MNALSKMLLLLFNLNHLAIDTLIKNAAFFAQLNHRAIDALIKNVASSVHFN